MNKEEYKVYIKNKIETKLEERLDTNEIFLITQKGCPSCETVKQFVNDSIKTGDVKLLYINTKEAEEIADKLNIVTVPIAIIKTNNGLKELDIKEFMYKYGNE